MSKATTGKHVNQLHGTPVHNNVQWWFKVLPINDTARKWFSEGQIMTEREYVTTLYTMRNRVIEKFVLEKLNTYKPTQLVPKSA